MVNFHHVLSTFNISFLRAWGPARGGAFGRSGRSASRAPDNKPERTRRTQGVLSRIAGTVRPIPTRVSRIADTARTKRYKK
jgi:hypothetical protein